MDWQAFLGGSYESQSPIADCERSVNWYMEQLQSPGASAKRALYPTPGVTILSSSAIGVGRAHFNMRSREFAIIGDTLYEVDQAGALTSRGTVTLDRNPATICSNGDLANQLFITSGTNGYIYDLTGNTLTQVAALNGKATMGAHLDGYFLALDSATSTLYASNLGDGLTWQTGIQWAQRSAMPDPWKAMKVVGRNIWLWGEQTTEIWYDAGNFFPFALYPGSVMMFGIKSPWSPAILGADVVWLGTTNTGRVCVIKGSGFNTSIISTYPLESAAFNYLNPEEAVGDSYSDRGHTFYLIGFDKSSVTWAWDQETSLWHERGTWLDTYNRYSSWRPRFYAYAFGQHRMLDSGGGNILQLDANIATDADGSAIRRMRRAPAVVNNNDRIFYSSLELLLEPGLGTITDSGVERAPLVTLRQSNDGGKTWPIADQPRSAGKLGEYTQRVRWNGLGSARRRVFEVVVSDAIPWRLVGADLWISQTETELENTKRTA